MNPRIPESTTPFVRLVTFDPAYDKRPKNPGDPDYGIHGVTLRFLLTGPLGAIQFVVYTNWHLPETTERLRTQPYDAIGGDPHWMERPMPADLGYHSYVPRYEGQSSMGSCAFLGGAECYYDGSTLNAEPVFVRLLREGDAGVWDALEQYYRQTFEVADAE